jgi:nickel-dependent lactate racemase
MAVVALRTAAWYGDRPLPLELPAGWRVTTLRPSTPPPLDDHQIALALERPVGQPPLRELARGRSRPLVIVDDPTRPTPAGRVLPVVLLHLAEAGIPAGAVRVLVATGTHGPPRPEALAAKVGPEAAAACRLLVHDHTRDLARVGRTSFGTPVLVNREVLASDLVIGVGGVYPQHSTGFGGGAKLALGVLGKRSIVALHYRHPSMDGSYEVANDFRRDLDQVAAMVGLHTSVSVHVDADRRPVRVVCGDHRRYYPEAVAFSLWAYRAPGPGDADVVIANAYPIDVSLTFMRSKGVSPLLLAKPGASRVLVSACSEGGGHHGLFPFVDAPRRQGLLHLARTVSARPGTVPAKAARRLRAALRRGRGGGSAAPGGGRPIWLHVPGRPAVDLPAEIPGMTALGAWPEVLARIDAEQGHRPGIEVAVYPCAPLQVLQPAGSPATLAPAT